MMAKKSAHEGDTMTKAEAKWLGEEIGFGPVYRFQRLVFQGPNSYTVEVIDNRSGDRREVTGWAEWDALARETVPQHSSDAQGGASMPEVA